jgi:hypothetical protein
VAYGPLRVSSQAPFQVLRLGLTPRAPATLGRGEREVRVGATWANVWAHGRGYFLDFEMVESSIAVAYGASSAVELEVELQNRTRFGGDLDELALWFHDTFGFTQDGRDLVPDDEFAVEVSGPDGLPAAVLDASDKGSFSRSALLTVHHTIHRGGGGAPAISYAVTGRVETASSDEITGGGRVDVGASVALAHRVGRFHLYGTLGGARFARSRFQKLELRDSQLSVLAAGEWRYGSRQSLILQYLVSEGLVDGLAPFSKPSHEVALGWKGELLPGTVLELGFIENVAVFDNSADFGFELAFARRF